MKAQKRKIIRIFGLFFPWSFLILKGRGQSLSSHLIKYSIKISICLISSDESCKFYTIMTSQRIIFHILIIHQRRVVQFIRKDKASVIFYYFIRSHLKLGLVCFLWIRKAIGVGWLGFKRVNHKKIKTNIIQPFRLWFDIKFNS